MSDNLESLEQELLEAQIREKELREKLRLAKLAQPLILYASKRKHFVDLTREIICVVFSKYRQDAVFHIAGYNRKYNPDTKENYLTIAKYVEYRESLKNHNYELTEGEVKLKEDEAVTKMVEDFIKERDDPTLFEVSLSEKNLLIKCKKRTSPYTITGYVPNATVEHDYTLRVPKSEGWRLLKSVPNIEERYNYKDEWIKWEEEALAFCTEQLDRRNKLAEIKKLETTEYPVQLNGYEQRGFQKVGSLFAEIAGNAIIADVMGLGKSLEALAVAIKNNYRTLIIPPASLVLNWNHEIQKYSKEIPYIFTGRTPEESDMMKLLVDKKQFNLINYEALTEFINHDASYTNDLGNKVVKTEERNLWVELLNMSNFDLIIIDEAHYIKNIDSKRSKAVRKLKGDRTVFLTGTPVMNRPGELFPMLNIIDPVQFPSYTGFMMAYSNGKNGVRNVKELRELLEPVMIRRHKKDVVKELPPINRIVRYFELSQQAREQYQEVLEGVYRSLSGKEYDVPNILAQIVRCKQICSLDATQHVADLATEIVDEGEGDEGGDNYNKVIIFSQFLESVGHINKLLGDQYPLTITGEMSQDKRMDNVKLFQENPLHKYIICSTKAASEGLNMTAAGSVILTDLMWTPAAHEQAEGRAYGRMSDSHTIDSYYLIAKDTIMEWIWYLLESKMNTIEATLDGKESKFESIANELIERMKYGRF